MHLSWDSNGSATAEPGHGKLAPAVAGEGDGVKTGWPERPATQQATHGEPQPPPTAVHLQRLDRIAGTARREPAWRGPTLRCALIPPYEANQPLVVRTSRWISNCSSLNDGGVPPWRTPIRYQPGGGGDDASSARNWRRRRFRVTAGPQARLMAKATLGGVADESGRNVHHRTPARARRPSRDKRVNALRSRIRQIKPTGGGGPWHGGSSARRARPGCSFADESRASWHDDDCSVGRCASRNPPYRGPALGPTAASGAHHQGAHDDKMRWIARAQCDRPHKRPSVKPRQATAGRGRLPTAERRFGAMPTTCYGGLPVPSALVHTCGQRCGRGSDRGTDSTRRCW